MCGIIGDWRILLLTSPTLIVRHQSSLLFRGAEPCSRTSNKMLIQYNNCSCSIKSRFKQICLQLGSECFRSFACPYFKRQCIPQVRRSRTERPVTIMQNWFDDMPADVGLLSVVSWKVCTVLSVCECIKNVPILFRYLAFVSPYFFDYNVGLYNNYNTARCP